MRCLPSINYIQKNYEMATANTVHPKTEDMESYLVTANLKRATIEIIVVIKYVQFA